MKTSQVIISDSIHPKPSAVEVSAARILAKHYHTTVEFIAPRNSYKQKTPDILMSGMLWEIKSPRGASKNTIEVQAKIAMRQSNNIVLDGRYTKLSDSTIVKRLYLLSRYIKRVNRIVFITKMNTVIDIYKKK